MQTYDIIARKRDGFELTSEEIGFLVNGFTTGEIPDYQMSAWAMAVFFRGMTSRETADLTMAMVNSGDRVNLTGIAGKKVDKHSTGGVGDKTTLVLAPLVAAAGVPVAKMSGRGLGHTGGTLDKLEAIPGFRVELTDTEFINNVNRLKLAVVGQTGNLVPADKKLYALRDVTATVNSIPLIASSVMSKKIASGADGIVLDVKAGSGAFMKTVEEAEKLASAMVAIGEITGRRTVALVTNMDQPLGNAIGNVLEVREAIKSLQGKGPRDLEELCLALGSEMLVLSGLYSDAGQASLALKQVWESGAAFEKFKEFVLAQGGDTKVVDQPELLPTAKYILPVLAEQAGYVASIDAEIIGRCAMLLGAGRETKESPIDLAVGLVLDKKVGSKVSSGDVLGYVHGNDSNRLESVLPLIKAAYGFMDREPEKKELIYRRVASPN